MIRIKIKPLACFRFIVHTNKAGGSAGPVNAPEGYGANAQIDDVENRHCGVYSVSAYFELPEGLNFNKFVKIKIVDEKEKISFYAEDNLIFEIALSDVSKVTTVIGGDYWQQERLGEEIVNGDCYRTIIVSDATGEEVMKVEEAVVPLVGLVGFGNRANSFKVDNITIELNYEITPTPTIDITPTPTATERNDSISIPRLDEKDKDSEFLTYGLMAASVLIIGFGVFILIKSSKKNDSIGND